MDITEAVTAAREKAQAMHLAGAPGRQVAIGLSAAMDDVVRQAVAETQAALGAPAEGQIWTVVALGGWGRGELCPGSDLDLLILHRRQNDVIAKLARGIFYPLWDAQLEVGHGVRTVAQCLSVSTLDLASRTSLLDARLLAGAPVLAEELRRGLLKQLRRAQGEAFFRALAAERTERHRQFGCRTITNPGDGGLAEPNIKDGPGGLRDIHGIGWALKVLAEVRVSERRPLPQLEQNDAVEEAADFLVRLRNHLHFMSGRKVDQLLRRYQPGVAQFLGFADPAALLEATEAHMSVICSAAQDLWSQLVKARGWR